MRNQTGNKKSVIGIFLFLCMIIYCILCAIIQDISIMHAISFVGFEIFGIFSIGFSIVHIMKIKDEDRIKLFGLAYALGYGASILLYLISFFALGYTGFRIFFIIIMIGSFIFNFYVKKKQGYFVQASKSGLFPVVIFIIILSFQLFSFALNNCSTIYLGENSYYVDLLHWASDAVTFTKKFPPINFRGMSSKRYYYHYFSAIQVAVSSMVTGIPVFNFVMGFSFIQSAWLLVSSTYIFFNEIMHNRFFICAGMILTLFSTGQDYYSWITPASHMYIAPFGYDIGIAFGMLAFVVFIRQIKNKKLNIKYFILSMGLFFVCAGVKGPVSCIVLVMFGSGCIYLLLNSDKQGKISALVYGTILLLVFVFVFAVFTNGLLTGDSKTEQFLTAETENTILMQPQVSAIHDIFIQQFSLVGGQLLFLIYYIILANPAIYMCVLLGGIVHLCEHEKIEFIDVILSIGVIVGILLTRSLKLIGFSQIYFIMATFPFAVAFGLRGFQNCYELKLKRNSRKEWLWGIKVIICFFATIGVGLFINSMYFMPQVTSGYKKALYSLGLSEMRDFYLDGSHGIVECTELDDIGRKDYHYIVINDEERKAAEWIRENTESNCIIMSNLINSNVYGYNYLIGILAERWIWLEDEELVYRLANGEDVLDQLSKKGIQYLLLEKTEENLSNIVKTVYSNNHVIIVEIEHKKGIKR